MKQFYSLLFFLCCFGLSLNAQVTIASQDFDGLGGSTFCTDMLTSASFLTNSAASNSGGGGLDFSTVWFQTRTNTTGPVAPTSDNNDFIGVNDFGGGGAPDVGPDGTSVSTNNNFQFNDGDGLLSLRFEDIDMSGFTNRTLSFDYWINDTGYESGDVFLVNITDGTNTAQVLGFNDGLMESNSSADNGTANWMSFSMNIDADIAGFDDTQIQIQIGVDNNASSENVFVDNIEVTGEPSVASGCDELFFSQYMEGSGNNKCLEIYNPTDAAVSLDGVYSILLYSNTNTSANGTINLTGSIASGDVLVVCNGGQAILPPGEVDITSGTVSHNGNDAYTLTKNGTVVDAIGQIGSGINYGPDVTLVRQSSITTGDTNGNDAFNTFDEWYSAGFNSGIGFGEHLADGCESCSITNVVISNLDCGNAPNEDDSFFNISFDVNNGTGEYRVANPNNNNTLYTFIGTSILDGTVGGIGQANAAAAEGTFAQVVVFDDNNTACISDPVTIMVPNCPGCSAGAGDLVITEIMQNPGFPDLNDGDAEYFEVYNSTGSDIDMAGIVISDQDFDAHTIASSVIVPAGGYAVLMRDGNTSVNGGVTADYVYGDDFFLGNSSDEVILSCNGTIIDMVSYDNGSTFPDPNGASMSLNPDALDANSNDLGANWCESSTEYFSNNNGTPGTPNDLCCDIDINGVSTTEACPGVGGSITIFASCPSCDGIKYSINGGASYQSTNAFTGLSAGNYNVVVMDAGSSGCMDMATVNVPVPGTAVPEPWITTDVGNSGAAGNAYAYDSCEDEYTVSGGGNNTFPGTNTDAVAFINQTRCGDMEIIAKLESVTPNGYGGLMMRETNAANAKQVSVFSNLTSIVRHEARFSTGGNKVVQAHNRPYPFWLKLVRQGDWFFAYYSTDGSNFQYIHAVNVPMNSCVQVGLASFTYFPGQQCTAVFSNVSVFGGFGGSTAEVPVEGVEFETEKLSSSTLYPNPATNMVNIELGTAREQATTLRLRNELGQVVEQRRLEVPAVKATLDVSGLNNGMYFIEVVTEGREREVLRFIKAQ